MNDMEQNFLAGKLLRILRGWINNIIPEETKDCIRSKTGIIVDIADEKDYYNIVLPEDYDKYYLLGNESVDVSLTQEERDKAKEERDNLIIRVKDIIGRDARGSRLFINDIVTIAYTDNKLTNSFILYVNGSYTKS